MGGQIDRAAVTPRVPAGRRPPSPARPPTAEEEEPAPSTRSPTGRLLREIARSLTEAARLLADKPSSDAVETAIARLEKAREAVSILALERAAPERSAARPALADSPALLRRTELRRSASSPQTARAFVRETCVRWAVAREVASAAVDLASELVTNAVRHAADDAEAVVLAVELRPDALVLSVWDDGPGRPHVLPYRPGRSERGIGLRLVRQLSERWGWTDERGGKWVWARLALPDADDQRGPVRRTSHPGRRGTPGR